MEYNSKFWSHKAHVNLILKKVMSNVVSQY